MELRVLRIQQGKLVCMEMFNSGWLGWKTKEYALDYNMWKITPTLNTSHITSYFDCLSTKLAISGATNPGGQLDFDKTRLLEPWWGSCWFTK